MSWFPMRVTPALLLAIVALVCGCGDEPSASTPEAVRADITKALTGSEKSDCEFAKYETQRFIDQTTLSIPEFLDGLERFCRADPQDYLSTSVRVTRIKVNGDRASARIAPSGGEEPYGRHDVELVRDGVWKFDALTAVEIDRVRLDRRIGWLLSFLAPDETVDEGLCMGRRLDRLDDAQVAAAILRSDVDLVLDPALVCFIRPQARKSGLSVSATSCLLRVLHSKGRALLKAIAKDDEEALRGLLAGDRGACAHT
jgi:hypothetical protein